MLDSTREAKALTFGIDASTKEKKRKRNSRENLAHQNQNSKAKTKTMRDIAGIIIRVHVVSQDHTRPEGTDPGGCDT